MTGKIARQKAESLVRSVLWMARSWSQQARDHRRLYRKEIGQGVHQNPERRMYHHMEYVRYRDLRKCEMRNAREIAQAFGLCVAKGVGA